MAERQEQKQETSTVVRQPRRSWPRTWCWHRAARQVNGFRIYFRTLVGLDSCVRPNGRNQDGAFWLGHLGRTISQKGEVRRGAGCG